MDETIDNIDLDLSLVELERPLLNNVVPLCTIGEAKIETKEGKSRFVIPLQLEEAVVATNGKEVHPGFQVTDSIFMTPTGSLTQEIVNEKLARFQKAVLGKQGRFVPAEFVGQKVRVMFETKPDRDDPSIQRQRVKRYLRAS